MYLCSWTFVSVRGWQLVVVSYTLVVATRQHSQSSRAAYFVRRLHALARRPQEVSFLREGRERDANEAAELIEVSERAGPCRSQIATNGRIDALLVCLDLPQRRAYLFNCGTTVLASSVHNASQRSNLAGPEGTFTA